MAKTLILGLMPKDAKPHTHLPAGPWCFAGQEELFPDWFRQFQFLAEPLADISNLKAAIDQTWALTAHLLPRVAIKLSPQHNLPLSYWEVLLFPWLLQVTQQIVERWKRVQVLTSNYSSLKLTIPILDVKTSHFSFADEQDFTLRGALGLNFNHYLFSSLLLATHLPSTFTLETLPGITEDYPKTSPQSSFTGWLKLRVKNILRKLPCPHLKGFSLSQSLLFSLALAHKSLKKDQAQSLLTSQFTEEHLKALALPFDPLDLVIKTLPDSLAKLTHPLELKATQSPRTRIASLEAYEDSAYRQELAIFRGQGHHLIYVQHGGNYGQILYSCLTEAIEYRQQAFITWGWKEQAGAIGHFIPLPNPRLAKIAKAPKVSAQDYLLMVGTEMPLLGYRLDSHPTPLQIVAYRSAKVRFLKQLSPKLLPKTLYRPYFKVPTCLEDFTFLKSHFPNLTLCQGPLTPKLFGAKLLILDHHGTTLLEAMARNIPMLLYWNREHWPETPLANSLLDELKEAEIWFETPEACAAKAENVFPKALDWWQSPSVQAARKSFMEQWALTIKPSETALWMRTLKTV